MSDSEFTLDQSFWVPPGKRGRRVRYQKRMSERKNRTVGDIRYPVVYSCPLTLTIPGLDASYAPGKGWHSQNP